MQQFTAKTYNIPELKGISAKNIEEHLKLYAGYVKHANMILDLLTNGNFASESEVYSRNELQRRFAFEFCGMRNHEYYFASFEEGAKALSSESALSQKIAHDFGSVESFITKMKALAMTRGIGWAMLYYDKKNDTLLTQWVDEQHLGQLTDCSIVLALDVWEHSYVADYMPSGKKQYVEDFFENLNWDVIESNYLAAKNEK